jgi:predicted TIM-barrel fold metal-dependent hydrolase
VSGRTEGYIDVHHHLLPPALVEELERQGVSEVAGRALPAWSPALSLEAMDRNGVDLALLSVSATGVHFGDDRAATELARRCNDYGLELRASAPSRFGYFASLPLPDVEGSLVELERVLAAGADGIVLQSSHSDGSYLGDPRFDDLLAALDEHDALVFVHPAIPTIASSIQLDIPVFGMEFTFDTTRAAFNLAYNGCLERFDRTRWILAHAGGTVPYLVSRFSLLWLQDDALVERAPKGALEYLASMYYDTALSANAHALSSLSELVGFDHVLFGSDYPFAPELAMTVSVASLEGDARFSPEDLALVRSGTARRLLAGGR